MTSESDTRYPFNDQQTNRKLIDKTNHGKMMITMTFNQHIYIEKIKTCLAGKKYIQVYYVLKYRRHFYINSSTCLS